MTKRSRSQFHNVHLGCRLFRLPASAAGRRGAGQAIVCPIDGGAAASDHNTALQPEAARQQAAGTLLDACGSC